MVKPHRAPVRPRVIAPASGETLWLEDVVREEERLALSSGPGAGKTTALGHIAALFPDRICADGPVAFILKTRDEDLPLSHVPQFRLAPWSIEDCFEYLKARHPERARAVTARLASDPDFARLEGNAQLLTSVMDRMADDPDLVDIRTAILRAVTADPAEFREVAATMFAEAVFDARSRPSSTDGLADHARHMARHAVVRRLLMAEHAIHHLNDDLFVPFPLTDVFAELIDEIATGIARSPTGLSQIRYLSSHGRKEIQPLAASIAHATKTGWRPHERRRLTLTGARLDGADWPGLELRDAMLESVRLRGANLAGAVLENANAIRAALAGARLDRATLGGSKFEGADLSGASLRSVAAELVSFRNATLAGARFDRGLLRGSVFTGANVKGAVFEGADLREARFTGADVEGADFTDANLEEARLASLPMNRTRLKGARFARAMCITTDFEGVDLPGADFSGADLHGAAFTHASMKGARFGGAQLQGARLAEVDWEGADLSTADLQKASFHLGTSRSGLVFSTTPCEGSKTGFYTDDFQDRNCAPELIRKANLCGADLRGANLRDTDFYLVDLRGAQISPRDVPHLKACGAILGGGTEE